MQAPLRATIFAIALALAAPVLAQAEGPIVSVESGRLEGRVADDVVSFKGIPYAAPPVGSLRWRSPQPVKPWGGTRKALSFGNDCMQMPLGGDAAAPGIVPAEDCLFLNVWRPAAIVPGARLPVAVWIHGGAFVSGGSSSPIYDGSALARQGAILVSLNYRLGRFGFFSHPALAAAQEGPIGNFGLMDQIAALQWIKRNIVAFGGDPEQLTVIGESAGGISVMALLTTPEAKGLFQRAVVMSGGGRTLLIAGGKLTGGTVAELSADQVGENFAQGLGVQGSGPAALQALRALPATAVRGDLDGSKLAAKPVGPPTYAGGPITDGALVIATPQEMLRRDAAAGVPLMIGSTDLDLPLAFPLSKDNPLAMFGDDLERARVAYDAAGGPPAGPFYYMPNEHLYFMIGSDMTMQEPARFAARAMTRAGQPVWLYRFGYVAQALRGKVPGATHSSELPFLFGTLPARYGTSVDDRDRDTARTFGGYVANFVRSGDPNGGDLPQWPRYALGRSDLMLFTPDKGPTAVPDPWADRLDLVEQVAEAQARLAAAAHDLAGSWQLVKFTDGGEVLAPDAKGKYALAFEANGHVSLRIDCNRGGGTWRSPGAGRIETGPLALTRAMCPPAALNDRLPKDWADMREFSVKDGHLLLKLAGGGVYEFEPMPPAPR